MKRIAPSLILGLCCFASSLVLAEATQAVHMGKNVSREQVIDLLAPKPQKPLTRGLHLKMPEEEPQQQPRALSLEVYFDFNSADLSDTAKQQLYPVGQALQSNELSNVSFTLEGHTDASGDDNYNLSLSERRAASVKAFFVQEFQVDPGRVAAFGKGESELMDTNHPNSGVNRRVTIIAE